MPRSASELLRVVDECAMVSATAPAMKKLTNGVAMPSFSPLSTFRMRRIRAGTCSSSTTWAPSAASVGATAAAITAAAHGSRSGKSTHRQGRAEGDGERQPDEQQAQLDAGVVAQHADVHPGRVREEQQRQRHLGEVPERLGVNVDVDHRHWVVGEHEPDDHECDRRADVERLELGRDEPHSDERRRDGNDQARVETLHSLLLLRAQDVEGRAAPNTAIVRRGTRPSPYIARSGVFRRAPRGASPSRHGATVGASVGARTMGTRCSRSGSWRRSGRR